MIEVSGTSEPVKQRSEPVACLECGRPTWSAEGVCTPCRKPPFIQQPPGATGETEPVLVMPALDDAGNLADDVHCRRCGYNLRGLNPAGICPECELPASRSIFGDWLRMCDPGWIKRLKTGIHLLLGSILGGIAFWIIFMVAIMFMGAMAAGGGFVPVMTVMMIATGILGLIWFAGVWLLTTPDPGAEQVESPRSARSVARWCSVAAIAAMPLGVYQQAGFNLAAPALAATPLDTLLLALSTLLGFVGVIAIAAGVIYLQSLALRIPAHGIANKTRVAGWGYVIVAGLGQVLGLMMMFLLPGMAGGAAGAPGAGVFGAAFILWSVLGCAIGLVSLVFGIWMIVLLFLYAAAFNKALMQAKQ